MEAVKQGAACVGLRSSTHAVLATLKRSASALASYQRKIFRVDDHMGIAIAGLNADGRVLCRFMRSECLSHKFVFESPLPVGRLVAEVGECFSMAVLSYKANGSVADPRYGQPGSIRFISFCDDRNAEMILLQTKFMGCCTRAVASFGKLAESLPDSSFMHYRALQSFRVVSSVVRC